MTIHSRLLVLGLLAAVLPAAHAGDWPQFRGPNRDGVSAETGVPLEWSATKHIVWRTPLPGPGASCADGGRPGMTLNATIGLRHVSSHQPGRRCAIERLTSCPDERREGRR